MKRFLVLALIALVFAFVSPDTRAATGLSSPVLTNFNLLSFNIVGTGPPTNMIQLNLDLSQFDPGPLRIKSSFLTNYISNYFNGLITTNYFLVGRTNIAVTTTAAGTNVTFTLDWIPVVDKLQVTNLTVINLTNTFQTNVNQIFTNIIVTNITFEGPTYFTTNAAPIFYSTTIFTNVEIFEYSTTNFFQNILNVYNSVTNGGDTIVNNYTNTTWNLSSNYFFFDPLTVIRIAGNTYITNGPVNIINAPITITNGPITTYITNGPAISIFVTNGPGITINNTPVAVLDTNTFNPTQFVINPTNMVNFKAGAHVTNIVNTGTIALSGSSYTFPLGVPMAGGLLVNPATNLDVLEWQGSQQFPISQTVFFTTTTNPAIVIYPGGNTNTPIVVGGGVNYWTNTVVSGVTNLQPIDLTLPLLFTNGVYFSSSESHGLFPASYGLAYSNSVASPLFKIINGSGTEFILGINGAGIPALSGTAGQINYNGNEVLLGNLSAILPGSYIETYGYNDFNFADYSRVRISHTGTNGYILYDSESGGIAGLPRPHHFDTGGQTITTNNLLEVSNNGTNKFTVAANSGYDGSGTHFLSDDGTYKAAGVTATNITYGFFDFDGATHGYTNTASPTIIDFGGTKMQTPGLAPGYYLVTVSLNAYFPIQPHNLDPTLIDCEIAIIDSEIGTATPGSLKTAWLSYNGTNDPPFSSFIPMTTQGLCQILTNGSTISVQAYCLAVSGLGPTASVVDKTGATISYIKVQ